MLICEKQVYKTLNTWNMYELYYIPDILYPTNVVLIYTAISLYLGLFGMDSDTSDRISKSIGFDLPHFTLQKAEMFHLVILSR